MAVISPNVLVVNNNVPAKSVKESGAKIG